MNNDSTQYRWHSRCANLSSSQGKTIQAGWINSDYRTPPGSWDAYFSDIAFLLTDGTVTPVYIRQAAISLSEWGLGSVSNTGMALEASNQTGDSVQGYTTTTYYTGDHLGSTRLVTAGGGWPVSSDTFYPFGQEQSATADPSHYKFAGLERDAESGLDHAMFRQYSSTTGRWMSPDPYNGSMDINYPQTFNRYAYVGNNPARLYRSERTSVRRSASTK